MNKFLLPIAALAMIMLPAVANAEQCRDSATGKFAKCGAPGSVLASKYMAKGKPKMVGHPMASMAPMAKPAKPGMMSMFKPKPAMAKPVRCKTPKGKFVKCGTPGAVPA